MTLCCCMKFAEQLSRWKFPKGKLVTFFSFFSTALSQGGTSALSPLSCSFSFFMARLIVVVSTCLVCNSSIVRRYQLPILLCLCFIRFVFLVRSFCIW